MKFNSAAEIKNLYPNSRSGWYEIKGKNIWCDMESDGGGWMLVARVTKQTDYKTADAIGDIVKLNDEISTKLSDDFINELRTDSVYSGTTPWRAYAENFDVFPNNPEINVPDRLKTQKIYISSIMKNFNAENFAKNISGSQYLHIDYEHPVCMKKLHDTDAVGFGDSFSSGDTYFCWAKHNIFGFHSRWRGTSPGTFWVK